MDSKQQRKQQRFERIQQVMGLFETLLVLWTSYTIKPCFAHAPNQQRKFNVLAEKKRKQRGQYITDIDTFIHCSIFFESTSNGIRERCPNPSQIKKTYREILKKYKLAVNWLNQWSAELRKTHEFDIVSDFEKCVRRNSFPSYDITNSFETEAEANAHVKLIQFPPPVSVLSQVDATTIELDDEDETFPVGYNILRVSRRGTAFATQDHDAFMSCLEYGITNATLADQDAIVLGRRFFPEIKHNIGTFGNFTLSLTFELEESKTITINSACKEIRSRLNNDATSLATFNLLCKRRIISLINTNDTLGVKVIFCGHPGCVHADGFIWQVDGSSIPARESLTHSLCPNDHAFCVRCFRPEHEGFCAGTETDRQELLTMRNQRLCPTCKTIIFKDGGCNHMTCSNCHQNFCWQCYRKFTRSERYVAHGNCNQFDDDVDVVLVVGW